MCLWPGGSCNREIKVNPRLCAKAWEVGLGDWARQILSMTFDGGHMPAWINILPPSLHHFPALLLPPMLPFKKIQQVSWDLFAHLSGQTPSICPYVYCWSVVFLRSFRGFGNKDPPLRLTLSTAGMSKVGKDAFSSFSANYLRNRRHF